MIFQFKKYAPKMRMPHDGYIAPASVIIGNVAIGRKVSIWFQTVIRGDDEEIVIGNNTNIQDGSVLHTDPGYPIVVGNNVTVGHKCILHGCTISDNCLIGMGSVLLSGCKIGKNCIIGANSLIVQNKEIPDNSLFFGNPARKLRTINENDLELIKNSVDYYVKKIDEYKNKKNFKFIE